MLSLVEQSETGSINSIDILLRKKEALQKTLEEEMTQKSAVRSFFSFVSYISDRPESFSDRPDIFDQIFTKLNIHSLMNIDDLGNALKILQAIPVERKGERLSLNKILKEDGKQCFPDEDSKEDTSVLEGFTEIDSPIYKLF